MRAFVTLMFSCSLLMSVHVRAQEALTIATPSGRPLVWDPEFTVPDHNSETEMVAFRVLPFEVDTADVPFFIDREGIVVPRVETGASSAALSENGRFIVLLCSFPESGSFNIALPRVRSEYCILRRAERQP